MESAVTADAQLQVIMTGVPLLLPSPTLHCRHNRPRVCRRYAHAARSSDSWRCPPTALVLNKIDLMRQHAPGPGVADTALAALERRLRSLHTFAAAFRTCALTGDGVPSLREWLLNRVSNEVCSCSC